MPRIIKSTSGEALTFVGKFDTTEKSVRGDDDIYRPFTPEQRFKRNRVARLLAENRILPTPLSVQPLLPKTVLIVASNNWNIVYGPELHNEASYLKGITDYCSVCLIILVLFFLYVCFVYSMMYRTGAKNICTWQHSEQQSFSYYTFSYWEHISRSSYTGITNV